MTNLLSTTCPCGKLRLETFKEVSLDDIDIFYNINSQIQNIISAYDFVNLYLWAGKHKGKWKFCEGKIYIYYGDEDALFLPVGLTKISFEALLKTSDYLIEQGSRGNFIYVDYEYIKNNWDNINHYFNVSLDEDNSDYIYSIDNLVELSGKRLKKKRNLIRQFERNHPNYRVEKLQKNHFEECLKLTMWWADNKHANDNDAQAVQQAFADYEELRLGGLCIIVNDKVSAFSVYSEQNKDTVICHIEKFDPEIKGVAQLINRETAKKLQDEGYSFINREQDLGIPGLRRAKKSYDPIYKKTVCKLIRRG